MFQEAHVFISAEKVEDVTDEKIRAELSKAHAHAPTQWVRRSSRSADKEEIVVSLLQYLICPLDRAKAFHIHLLLKTETHLYRLPLQWHQGFTFSSSMFIQSCS